MTNRERLLAILHYKPYDRIPIMNFGFWRETLAKWQAEGHLTKEEVDAYNAYKDNFDGNEAELHISQKLGFDDTVLVFTGQKGAWYDMPLWPIFDTAIIKESVDGSYVALDQDGVMVKGRKGATSIQSEVGHTAKDRASWEANYAPRLKWTEERLDKETLKKLIAINDTRERHICLYAGSLFGKLRNYWGLVEISYLQEDDPKLFEECIDSIAEISYQIVKGTLESGVKLDFVHFWEDICYNHGPLIQPALFDKKVGKHYRRITDEAHKHGIDIVSVDCDGLIDALVPTWLDNGVNTMFPIEYGAWEYDFSVMRNKFGKELRGIGNINKNVLAKDRKMVDQEVERAKRLVDLGGFVPCLDHRIAPNAEWDLTKYYCDKMKEAFWK